LTIAIGRTAVYFRAAFHYRVYATAKVKIKFFVKKMIRFRKEMIRNEFLYLCAV
jgi:hypothetical protein